jgi:hypothetical protein
MNSTVTRIGASLTVGCVLVALSAPVSGAVSGAATGKWEVTELPGSQASWSSRIVPLADDDVWAFGQGYVGHWDGAKWETDRGPRDIMILGAGSSGPKDLWVSGTKDGGQTQVFDHWDGSGWTRTTAPESGPGGDFTTIAAVGPKDVWASGGCCGRTPFTYHWNGVSWTKIALPEGNTLKVLTSLSATPTGTAWLLGAQSRPDGYRPWLGRGGTGGLAAVELPLASGDTLKAVHARSDHDVWVAGVATEGEQQVPLLLHFDGAEWTRNTAPANPGCQPGDFVEIRDRLFVVGTGTARGCLLSYGSGAWQAVCGDSETGFAVVDAGGAVGGDTVWAVGSRGSARSVGAMWVGRYRVGASR